MIRPAALFQFAEDMLDKNGGSHRGLFVSYCTSSKRRKLASLQTNCCRAQCTHDSSNPLYPKSHGRKKHKRSWNETYKTLKYL